MICKVTFIENHGIFLTFIKSNVLEASGSENIGRM